MKMTIIKIDGYILSKTIGGTVVTVEKDGDIKHVLSNGLPLTEETAKHFIWSAFKPEGK